MARTLIQVITTNVMYNNVLYMIGDTLEVENEHILLDCMRVIEDDYEERAPITREDEPLIPHIEGLKALSLDRLKEYAEEFGINLGKARTKEGIIEKILEAQKEA